MRVTFIDPPNLLEKKNFERVFGCTYSLYPLPNIFSVTNAAVLKNDGFDVVYIDMANQRWPLQKLKDFFDKDDSGAYVFHCVNLSKESDLAAHTLIRGIKTNIPIIFSGPSPTYFAQDFLKDENTFVVRGEAEFTLLELIRALGEKKSIGEVKGVSFLRDKEFLHNPPRPLIEDLDILPFPDRGLLKKELYYNPKLGLRPFTAVQTSRNCAYRCSFCVPNSYNFARELEYRKYNANNKPRVQARSAENVIAEFKQLAKDGYRAISVIDDQFLWDEQRTIKICAGIKDLGIAWGCLARADHISDEVVKQMRDAGCRYIDMGVESFSQEVLDDIKKDLKVQKVYEAIRVLKKYRVMVKINLVLGVSPLQDKEKILADIRLSKRLGADAVMFSLATPFPGTDFYRRAVENKWFEAGAYRPESVQSKAIINYPKISSKELDRMLRVANLSFYFRPGFVFKNLKQLINPLNFFRGLLALKRKFF